jgi:cohesin complex subunit SCC1
MDVDGGHIPGADDTTLLSNVSDEFVLPPISTGKLKKAKFIFLFDCFFKAQTPAARQAVKRKRKLVIDEVKEIDSASMKTQLSDTTDIVGVLELAPPTRRLMHLKETGGIEKLFSLSATSIFSKTLQQVIKNVPLLFHKIFYFS